MTKQENNKEDDKKRGSLIWPIILIVIGILLLLNNIGVIPWTVWASLIGLWPLILVFVGLELMTESSGFGRVAVRIIEAIIVFYIFVYVVSLYHSGFNSFLRSKFKWWPKQNKLFFREPSEFRMRRWND